MPHLEIKHVYRAQGTKIEKLHNETDEDGNECEGFVLRTTKSFPYAAFRRNVGKYVRASHVQTNQHWLRTSIVKNKLTEEKI